MNNGFCSHKACAAILGQCWHDGVVVSDSIELLGHLASFWLFLFNRSYRQAPVAEWREGGWLKRFFMMFEGSMSALIGVAVPVLLLRVVFT